MLFSHVWFLNTELNIDELSITNLLMINDHCNELGL